MSQPYMFAVATLVSSDEDVTAAITLAKSVRLFSMAKTVAMLSPQLNTRISQLKLQRVFDEVLSVDSLSTPEDAKWNIFGLQQYTKILYIPPRSMIVAPIDQVFLHSVPAAVFDGLTIVGPILIQPSRFTLDLLRIEAPSLLNDAVTDSDMINLFYQRHGYDWTSISPTYYSSETDAMIDYRSQSERMDAISVARSDRSDTLDSLARKDSSLRTMETKIVKMTSTPWNTPENTQFPSNVWNGIYSDRYQETKRRTRSSLHNHLITILEPILGKDIKKVLSKYFSLYQQAFTTKAANPASNYDLLEAYGDRFLAGQYAWLLIRTPGIINADQVTKVSSYFQNQYQLEKVTEHLRLTPYIVAARGESLNTKIRSDVIESLIGAIGISYQNMFKNGDTAMRNFIFKVWGTFFTIDPANIRLLYEESKTRFKELAEQLQIDRSLIKAPIMTTNPQEGGGEIIITVMYGPYTMGIGKASLDGLYRDTAIKMAERAAYADALEKGSLQLLLNSQSS